MPAQTGQSQFLAKVLNRLDAAVRGHADDPVDTGFQPLPPMKGVARLTECGFFQCEKDTKMKKADGSPAVGEFYFRMRGAIVEPKTVVDGGAVRNVEGVQIDSKIIPVFDTKNGKGEVVTAEEHLTSARDNVLNCLKMMGAKIPKKAGVATQLPAIAAALLKTQPYFRFEVAEGREDAGKIDPRTGKPYPPRNWTRYYEALPNYVPGEDSTVDDETDPVVSANGHAPAARGGRAASQPTQPEPEANDEGSYSDSDDLDSLLERANADDGDAQARLKELAVAAGHSEEACDATSSWEELKDLIGQEPEAGGEGEDADADADAEDWLPVKGDVYPVKIKTWDAKTKKHVVAKKAVDCEVLSVDPKANAVTLKNLVTGKPVLGQDGKPMRVSFDDLIRE